MRSLAAIKQVMWYSRFQSAVVAITVSCILGSGCKHETFLGDGQLVDHGAWSYPRYEAIFPPFNPLSQSSLTLKCKGIPSDTMTFGLRVARPTDTSNEAFFSNPKWAAVVLDVKIEKGDSASPIRVAEANAPVSEWSQSRSISQTTLWHEKLRDLSFDGNSWYTINIRFLGVDLGNQPVSLIAVLEGGGNETP